MKVKDILEKMNEFAPWALSYDWDNTGLLCGDREQEVTGICVCLDASLEALEKAVKNNCNVLFTHHPFIFRKIGQVDYNSYFGKMLQFALKSNISVISAHTNMDKAKSGINQRLAEIVGLKNIQVLEADERFEGAGMGRYGELENEMTFVEFCQIVGERLNTDLRAVGNKDKIIRKAAVGGGSCIEMADIAIEKGCDVLITGDVKYHEALDYMREGLCIIDAGHYATEICVVDIFEDIFKDCGVKVVKELNNEVYSFVIKNESHIM